MAKINLLPWREELRKQKQREFASMSGGSAIIAGLIVLLAHFHVDGLIDNQNQRNGVQVESIADSKKPKIIKGIPTASASAVLRIK